MLTRGSQTILGLVVLALLGENAVGRDQRPSPQAASSDPELDAPVVNTSPPATFKRHPNNRAVLQAIIDYSVELGRTQDAVEYARRLVATDPTDAEARSLLEQLDLPPAVQR
jgi:hypothetical protein